MKDTLRLGGCILEEREPLLSASDLALDPTARIVSRCMSSPRLSWACFKPPPQPPRCNTRTRSCSSFCSSITALVTLIFSHSLMLFCALNKYSTPISSYGQLKYSFNTWGDVNPVEELYVRSPAVSEAYCITRSILAAWRLAEWRDTSLSWGVCHAELGFGNRL